MDDYLEHKHSSCMRLQTELRNEVLWLHGCCFWPQRKQLCVFITSRENCCVEAGRGHLSWRKRTHTSCASLILIPSLSLSLSSADSIVLRELLLQAGLLHPGESRSNHLCKLWRRHLLNTFHAGRHTAAGLISHSPSILYLHRAVAWTKPLSFKMFLFDSSCEQTFRKNSQFGE